MNKESPSKPNKDKRSKTILALYCQRRSESCPCKSTTVLLTETLLRREDCLAIVLSICRLLGDPRYCTTQQPEGRRDHLPLPRSIVFLNFSSCSGSTCTVSRMDKVGWLERIPYCDVELCWTAKKKIRVVDITRARVAIASTVLFSASARVIF